MEFREKAFTGRELEIAHYLLENKTLPEIMQLTGLKRKLVKAHLRNMREKLHVANIKSLRRRMVENFK